MNFEDHIIKVLSETDGERPSPEDMAKRGVEAARRLASRLKASKPSPVEEEGEEGTETASVRPIPRPVEPALEDDPRPSVASPEDQADQALKQLEIETGLDFSEGPGGIETSDKPKLLSLFGKKIERAIPKVVNKPEPKSKPKPEPKRHKFPRSKI